MQNVKEAQKGTLNAIIAVTASEKVEWSSWLPRMTTQVEGGCCTYDREHMWQQYRDLRAENCHHRNDAVVVANKLTLYSHRRSYECARVFLPRFLRWTRIQKNSIKGKIVQVSSVMWEQRYSTSLSLSLVYVLRLLQIRKYCKSTRRVCFQSMLPVQDHHIFSHIR